MTSSPRQCRRFLVNSRHGHSVTLRHTRESTATSLQFPRTPGRLADTGWEPAAVYRHLNRLTRIADAAGIPVVRVSRGHFRRDALDPAHRFASMPLWPPRVHEGLS
jgi:hypothetical protein